MKSDLNQYLINNHVEALWITGPAQQNPPMVYLTGGGHLTKADVIMRAGFEPILCHSPMERDEAANTGLTTLSYSRFPLKDRLAKTNGDHLAADALLYKYIFEEIGLTAGKVFIYGVSDVGKTHSLVNTLQDMLPALSFHGDVNDAVILQAMATKDADEIERIRNVSHIIVEMVSRVVDYLTNLQVRDNALIKSDGTFLTIGEVKRKINLWLAELGAENPKGTIFSIGRDAGVPHSSGNPTNLLTLGQTIVFDVFPCEAGGGYFSDFTRTWSLGYSTDEAQELYDQVKTVYDQVTSKLKSGVNPAIYQDRVCDLFESMGHVTIRQNPAAESGYVHGLGHGVGLQVHEKPWFGQTKDPLNILAPGSVFTIEPGLYYPEKGMGVRLEDTFFVKPNGQIEKMVDYPMELCLPIKRK